MMIWRGNSALVGDWDCMASSDGALFMDTQGVLERRRRRGVGRELLAMVRRRLGVGGEELWDCLLNIYD